MGDRQLTRSSSSVGVLSHGSRSMQGRLNTPKFILKAPTVNLSRLNTLKGNKNRLNPYKVPNMSSVVPLSPSRESFSQHQQSGLETWARIKHSGCSHKQENDCAVCDISTYTRTKAVSSCKRSGPLCLHYTRQLQYLPQCPCVVVVNKFVTWTVLDSFRACFQSGENSMERIEMILEECQLVMT